MNKEDCCNINELKKNTTYLCPNCQKNGRKIDILTVKALVKEGEIIRLQPNSTYYYCSSQECEVVYFNDNKENISIYLKSSIKTKIGTKLDKEGYICYCFGFTKTDLLNNPSLENVIKEKVKLKNCACEVKNIHGTCCLGDIRMVLKINNKVI